MRTERPMVNPGLRRVWRDTRTLQFGVDVQDPVVLQGVSGAMAQLLAALDGTLTRTDLLHRARVLRLDPDQVDTLLTQLEAQRVIVDGKYWPGSSQLSRDARERLLSDHNAQCLIRGTHHAVRRRERLASTEVIVYGVGRLGSTICSLLNASGVGCVVPVDDALVVATDLGAAGFSRSSLGQPRRLIADQAMSEQDDASPIRTKGLGGRWSVITNASPSRTVASRLLHQGERHLVTSVAEQWGRIGPLVRPGVTSCLRCFDLVQSERDPSWPTVAAQLDPIAPDIAGESNLVIVTAALAVLHLLEAIDEQEPPSTNGVTYVQLPHGATLQRDAPPSPRCGCTWPLTQHPIQAGDTDTMVA